MPGLLETCSISAPRQLSPAAVSALEPLFQGAASPCRSQQSRHLLYGRQSYSKWHIIFAAIGNLPIAGLSDSVSPLQAFKSIVRDGDGLCIGCMSLEKGYHSSLQCLRILHELSSLLQICLYTPVTRILSLRTLQLCIFANSLQVYSPQHYCISALLKYLCHKQHLTDSVSTKAAQKLGHSNEGLA